jgi:hypothetical protein
VPLRYGDWLRHFTASAPRHPVPVIAGVRRLEIAQAFAAPQQLIGSFVFHAPCLQN